RQARPELLENALRCLAGGDALRIGFEVWQVRVPLAGQLAPESSRELGGQLGMRLAIRSQLGVPLSLPALSSCDRGAEVPLPPPPPRERGLPRPAAGVLGGPAGP